LDTRKRRNHSLVVMTLILNLQLLDCARRTETRLLVTALGQIASYKPGLTKVFGFLKSFQLKRSGGSVNRSTLRTTGARRSACMSFAPPRSAPLRCATLRFARLSFAPPRFALKG